LWWLLPTSILAVVVSIGCCAGIFFWLIGSLKSSEPYQMALKRVCTDGQVIEMLGKPIEETGWMPTGSFPITSTTAWLRAKRTSVSRCLVRKTRLWFTLKCPAEMGGGSFVCFK
jgi:hypothetical protein